MKRIKVTSSNLVSIGYDNKTNTLVIEFKGGTVYQYFDVSEDEYDDLMNAPSHGVYFSANIRENYEFEKL